MFDFPNAPTTGEIITGPNNSQYQWDGVKWIPNVSPSTGVPSNSPVFTGNPTAPTPATSDSDQSLATTAFVHNVVNTLGAPVEAPNDGRMYGRQSQAWQPVLNV